MGVSQHKGLPRRPGIVPVDLSPCLDLPGALWFHRLESSACWDVRSEHPSGRSLTSARLKGYSVSATVVHFIATL